MAINSGQQRTRGRAQRGFGAVGQRRSAARPGQAGEVALHRALVQRVVVVAHQLAEQLGPARRARHRLPTLDALACLAARSARRAARKTARAPARRSRTPAAAVAPARHRPSARARSGACSRMRAPARRAPAARRPPALALDEHRPRRIEAAQRLPQQRVEALLRWLRSIGQAAEHRAAMAGQRLEVEHLRAQLGQRLQQPRLAAAGAPGDTVNSNRAAAAWRGRRAPPRETPCSRRAAARCETRSGRETRPARPSAGRRASSTPAAATRAAGPARSARCVPAMLRATSAAPSLRAASGESCTYNVPTMRRSSSSSTGQLTAPGRWSSANSAGERTSMIASKRSSAGAASRRTTRGSRTVSRLARAHRRSRRATRSRSRSCSRLCCSAAPSTRKVSSTRSPSVEILASCRLTWCRASTRAMPYSRPVRSLALTERIQRCARSSGRSETRGVTGNERTRRDTRPDAAQAARRSACSVATSWVSISEMRSR